MIARQLLACGVVAGPLFTAAWLAEGATRPGYDWRRHPVSALALGERGWTQVATFVSTGALTLAFAAGVRRGPAPGAGSRSGPWLIRAVGVGLIGAGVFTADPLSGYPPGSPPVPERPTVHGALHQLFSAPVFVGMPALCLLYARRLERRGERAWAAGSLVAGLAFLAAFVLASFGFGQHPRFVALGGLFQRVALTIGWAWLTAFALGLLQGHCRRRAD